jgi:PKD repeat protein
MPYIAEQESSNRGTITNGEYRSNLKFPDDGEYGHYRQVTLFDNSTPGVMDLKYIYETNTLYIERLDNIKELKIDCMMMYSAKSEEVLDQNSFDTGSEYYKTYFTETNEGLFTVIVNTDTPMEKLQFLSIPIPKRVLVNNKEWWNTETSYYSLTGQDILISNVPKGTTTVDIYFQEVTMIFPVANFVVSKEIVLEGEEFYLDAGDSYDEDGKIVTFLWDFGDESQGSGSLTKHSYSKSGNYTITLTVRDNNYLEAEATKQIFVITEDADSDNDNVPDLIDPNPLSAVDSDGDGLSDDYEQIMSRTNVNKTDSDGDGWDDKIELDSGTDPINPFDHLPEVKEEDKEEDLTGVIFIAIFIIIIIFILFMIIITKRKGYSKKDDDKKSDEKKDKKKKVDKERGKGDKKEIKDPLSSFEKKLVKKTGKEKSDKKSEEISSREMMSRRMKKRRS